MKTSSQGIDFIIRREALKLKAYRDSGGVLTIGVGHTSAAGEPKVRAGMVITEAEARIIFARDVAKFEARVIQRFGRDLPQNVFDGAVSFDLNTGAIDKASWPAAWLRGKFVDAERRLKLYNKDNGRTVQGLINRRQFEADLIFRGKYQ